MTPYMTYDIDTKYGHKNEPMFRKTPLFRGGLRALRYIVLLMMVMLIGVGEMWGDDFSGVWYIANETNHDNANIGTHWYLVPGADPHQPHYADAYFHNEYCNKNGKGDYTGDNYGDPEKPFLTTYQTNQDLNSIWIVVSTVDGYYNIIHAKTGKYIVYEPPYKDAPNRKSMHLESTSTSGDNAKFAITGSLSGPINIRPKNVISGNRFFNPATGVGNRPYYYGPSGDYFHDGMIGLYSGSGDNSQWYFEKASSATTLTPVISDVDGSTNTFTITSPAAAFSSIRYTTDGSTTPDASTGNTATSGSNIKITGSWNVQAVGVFGTFVTPVAGPKPLNSTQCDMPVISYDRITQLVSIACATTGANIYYTTNGTEPNAESLSYSESGPFSVIGLTIIRAIAIKSGIDNSEVASVSVVLNPTINLATETYTYDGTAKEPEVSSVMNGVDIIAKSEYDVAYSGNINAGTATVTITDIDGGNYIVGGSRTFTINRKAVTITADDKTISYGEEPVLTATVDGLIVGDNIDYVLSDNYEPGYDCGTYTIIPSAETPQGNYEVNSCENGTLTITKKALNKDALGTPADGITIRVSKDTSTDPATYSVTVTHDIQNTPPTALTLIQYVDDEHDYDYTLSGEASVSGYIATVTANENGNYTGFAKAIFADAKFWDDETPFNPKESYDPADPGNHEFAAVYQSMSDLVPNAGVCIVKAYIVKKVNPTIGTITISPVEYTVGETTTNYIPEGVPVLLLSNDENTGGLDVSPKHESTPGVTDAFINSNQLKLSESPDGVPVKDAEAYVFYRGEFVLTKEGIISPGKFFLYNPNYTPSSAGGGGGGPSGVRRYLRIVVEEGEDPDSMSEELRVESEGFATAEGWYTLDGRRLDGKPTRKGIYITNGKKMYFK